MLDRQERGSSSIQLVHQDLQRTIQADFPRSDEHPLDAFGLEAWVIVA